MPAQFSQRTLEMLAQMKWSESWNGCADRMQAELGKQGHVVPQCAVRFLQRFGWLSCEQPSPYQPGVVAFHTNAATAGAHIGPSELTQYEQRVGSRLCPIGEAGYGHFVLLMDEHERAFAVDDAGALTKWADSGEDLIESLCNVGRMEPVDESDCWPDSPSHPVGQ